jgi:hypothetical protein
LETMQVQKRLIQRWNGKRKVDVRHLANSKYVKFSFYLHDLFYQEDWVTGKGTFYRREKNWVFVKVSLPEKLSEVLKEKCLREY